MQDKFQTMSDQIITRNILFAMWLCLSDIKFLFQLSPLKCVHSWPIQL